MNWYPSKKFKSGRKLKPSEQYDLNWLVIDSLGIVIYKPTLPDGMTPRTSRFYRKARPPPIEPPEEGWGYGSKTS